jgi:tRNA pseudouridine-54 N-methylase
LEEEIKLKLTFLVPSPTIRTHTKRTIKSVVGGQERFDVLSRCLLNVYPWKDRMNVDLSLIFYFSHPNENNALHLPISSLKVNLQNEIDSTKELISIISDPSEYGYKIEAISFEELITNLANKSNLYYLSSQGNSLTKTIKNIQDRKSLCFVLGSQYDLTEKQEKILNDKGAYMVSIGEKEYLASHVITIVCYYLNEVL